MMAPVVAMVTPVTIIMTPVFVMFPPAASVAADPDRMNLLDIDARRA